MPSTARLALAFSLLACPARQQPSVAQTAGPTAAATDAKTEVAAAPSTPTKESKEAERRTLKFQLEQIDTAIASATKVAQTQVNSALTWERVANHHMSRARLTGSYDDYAAAEAAIDRAFAIHPTGFGPFRARASLNYTLHRLDRIDADIERAVKSEDQTSKTKSGALLFAGKLAFQRGQYADAVKLYDASIAAESNSANLAARAEYAWKTGDFDRAEALYLEADGKYHGPNPEPHAWNRLMRGLMDLDRGRYEDALAHYRDAEGWLRGWYLVDEHIAEVLTLMGKSAESKPLYVEIIERTDNPEFMDALAGVLLEEGKSAEATEYIERARARYEQQIARFPEAAAGHALEHFLEFGDDVARCVEMAEKNHTLRPNAEAKVLLARAYLKASRVDDAKRVIEQALATPWTSADLHTTAAVVYRKSGDTTRADAELAKAKAIDPHASEE